MEPEINWTAIREAYITTPTSYARLAEKHGISPSAIGARSRQEGWARQRREHCTRMVEQAKESGDPLEKLGKAVERAVAILASALEEKEQFYSDPVPVKTGKAEERVIRKLDTRELKYVVGMLKDLTGLQRELHDLPTAAEAEAREIARQRLEMDRLKLSGPGAVEVVLSAGEESWNE